MNDEKFAYLLTTAETITETYHAYTQLVAAMDAARVRLEVHTKLLDDAIKSKGRLDVVYPQEQVMKAMERLAFCEKSVDEQREKLIEAAAEIEAQEIFK